MYNLLRLEYSDEILKNIGGCCLSIQDHFALKDIGIDFKLLNSLLTGQINLEIQFNEGKYILNIKSFYKDFHPIAFMYLCSFTEVLTKLKEPAS